MRTTTTTHLIKLSFDQESKQVLSKLIPQRKFEDNSSFSFLELRELFDELNQRDQTTLSLEQRIGIEETKLKIMKAVLADIKYHCDNEEARQIAKKKKETEKQEAEEKEKKNVWWRKWGRYCLLIAFLLYSAVMEYSGFMSMVVTLIPNILNPVAMALSILLTAINTFFNAAFVAEYFGIVFAVKEKQRLAAIDNQITTNAEIKLALLTAANAKAMSFALFSEYAPTAKLFNESIRSKAKTFKASGDGIYWYWGLVIGGALLNTGAAYFGAVALVGMLGLTIASVWGILIVIAALGIALGMFISYQEPGIKAVVMPTVEEEQALEERLQTTETLQDEQIDQMKPMKPEMFPDDLAERRYHNEPDHKFRPRARSLAGTKVAFFPPLQTATAAPSPSMPQPSLTPELTEQQSSAMLFTAILK